MGRQPGKAMRGEIDSGTSSRAVGPLRRAVLVLRLLAGAGRRGIALTDLSKTAGLPHPTVHRILKQLIAERLVCRTDGAGLYRLGELTYELGLAAAEQYDIRGPCRPILAELADEVGDTVYLTLRSGPDAVCVDRYEGSSTIRLLTLEIGTRRPLGMGAGGLAILSALPEEQRQQVMETLALDPRLLTHVTPEAMQRQVERARRVGFALVRDQLTLGISAVGCHFCDTSGRPTGAASIAGVNERLSTARIPVLVARLRKAIQTIERVLRNTSKF
jgi:DNA-binding IclR family transcriptional regulator